MIWFYSLLPFIIIAFGLFIAFIIIGSIVFHKTMNDHKKSEKFTLSQLYSNGDELEKELAQFTCKTLVVKTTHNRRLESRHYTAIEPNGLTVVLVHGRQSNMFTTVQYAIEYLNRGFNVFMYNQRGINNSGGSCSTYGFYERFDLHGVVKYIKKNISDDKIIVHGFSMGASTSILQSELDKDDKIVDLYIVECPYKDLESILLYTAKQRKKKRPRKGSFYYKLLLNIGNVFNNIFLRFSYKEVSPITAIRSCTQPMLIIHAKGDTVCPYSMSEDLFDCKINGVRDIWTPDDSNHIRCYFDYKDKYLRKINAFIANNISEYSYKVD